MCANADRSRKPSENGADRIRRYVYETVVRPRLDGGAEEVAIRAGDVHSGLKLTNQMPNVCSAIESRKFTEAHGLELVRRDGPHRGSNAVYHFRRTGKSAANRPAENVSALHSGAPAAASPKSLPPKTPGTVYWMSCVSQKRSAAAPARDLYTSDWFTKARDYVESTGVPWFVLSAKYGLVPPDRVIEPYELTLNTLPVVERKRWAKLVQQQLEASGALPCKVVLLAGARYREFIEPYLRDAGVIVEVPMEGLRIGEQLSWLSRTARAGSRLDDLRRFYELLDRLEGKLGGKLTLEKCHGRMSWPARGVYFFFEPGENRSDSGSGLRVVRVGTHALSAGSSSTLWGRLSQHRGTTNNGGGNHRGSIFRLIVGAALKTRYSLMEPNSWGRGSDLRGAAVEIGVGAASLKRAEDVLERAVSDHLRRMPFLYLPVDDEPGPDSARSVIERNAIGLLSNFSRQALDAPSSAWLGHHSDRDRVRQSGLWNNRHVDENCDPSFLPLLDDLVAKCAAAGWDHHEHLNESSIQPKRI